MTEQLPPTGGYENAPRPPGGYGSMPPPAPGGYPGGGGYGGGAQGAPPPNHLVWAILSTLFCCLPLGIASIVFAAQVNGKWAAGDAAGAQDSSKKARQFALWGTIIGVVLVVLYGILLAAGALSVNNSKG
ncbi:MAG: CD225/dispanin family protein [Actinomycetota bacterium]|nr:CD225/dispanin family protein [Actinomycetota bacterium]